MPPLLDSLIWIATIGILALSFYGWGPMTLKQGFMFSEATSCQRIWAGYCLTLPIMMAVHLVLPLQAGWSLVWYGTGALLGIHATFRNRPSWPTSKGGMIFTLSVLLVLAWTSVRAMVIPQHYDSGLYHFQTIRWINEYPIVPGLGNLHGRLAFNQSLFPFVASLNLYPWVKTGYSFANSFLLLLTLLTQVETLWNHRKLPPSESSSATAWIPALLSLPILIWWLIQEDLSSPSTDFCSAILQIQLIVLFLQEILRPGKSSFTCTPARILLFQLCAIAVTVKLSTLFFCAAIVLILFLRDGWSAPKALRDRGICIILPVITMLLHLGRGTLLSGAPLFPSTFGYLAFPWAVPLPEIQETREIILAWARQPWAPEEEVLANLDWVSSWLPQFLHHKIEVLWPLMLFVMALLATLFLLRTPQARAHRPLTLLLAMLPTLIGLTFWLVTAPDPRFAFGLFATLPLAGISALIWISRTCLSGVATKRLVILALAGLSLAKMLHLIQSPELFSRWSRSGWQPLPQPEMYSRTTESGLIVYASTVRDQTWDAPLPTTPYFKPDLHLNTPEDLGSGFRRSEIQGPQSQDESAP